MITDYFRPSSLDIALEMLAQPNTIALGGGTLVNTPAFNSSRSMAVVDLQALGLDNIDKAGNSLNIGACVTLQTFLEHPLSFVALRSCLIQEAPLNIRNMATVAGTLISADGRSPFATVMLALDAKLTIASIRDREVISYGEFLPFLRERLVGRLVINISIPHNLELAWQAVSKTPDDKPIISVALARWPGGRYRMVLGGAGTTPLLGLDGTEVDGLVAAARNVLHNSSDEWGSAEYRMEIGALLVERCLAQLQVGSS